MTELEDVTGMNRKAAKKIREAGIATAELLAEQDIWELQERTRVGETLSEKLISNARRLIRKYAAKSGLQVESESDSRLRLKTGLPRLDGYLAGGFEQGSIVEFNGPARSGKSQWCHQLAVTAQLPTEEGALSGRVLWLDTENSFKPLLVRAIALRFGLDPSEALDTIRVQTVVDIRHMEETFDNIPPLCAKQNYVLVIVDNLGDLYQTDYIPLDEVKMRRIQFAHLAKRMRAIARATGAIFVYTNRVIETFGCVRSDPNAPLGGHLFAHVPDYRFKLKNRFYNNRYITLHDNVCLPPFESDICLGWGGFYENDRVRKATERAVVRGLFNIERPEEEGEQMPSIGVAFHDPLGDDDTDWYRET